MNNIYFITPKLILLWLFSSSVFINFSICQEASLSDSLDFIAYDKNQIQNPSSLANFYKALHNLEKGEKDVVNIMHIGDSHLQADFFTFIVRSGLHKKFGNAGRGLIFPFKIAQSNEPFNYNFSSDKNWKYKRCVFPNQKLPIGIGGITISTNSPNNNILLETYNYDSLNYAFNRIKIFYHHSPGSFDLTLRSDDLAPIQFICDEDLSDNCTEYIDLFDSYNVLALSPTQNYADQNHFTLFGISVANNEPGILYHVIAANGAKFEHFSKAKYFAEQSNSLDPRLIIFSLGTNEANDEDFSASKFEKDLEELHNKLKKENPAAEFLLISPASSHYYRSIRVNENMKTVGDIIIGFAKKNNIAYWDMFEITGGLASAQDWRQKGLMSKDNLHYTREAYEIQGSLFLNAIIAAYDEL